MSVVGQVLAGIKDDSLLKFIGMVNNELSELIDQFTEKEIAPDIPNDFEPMKDDMYGEISNDPDYDSKYGEGITDS